MRTSASVIRFLLEAGFLILTAACAGIAHLAWYGIVFVMAIAWGLVALVERTASRGVPATGGSFEDLIAGQGATERPDATREVSPRRGLWRGRAQTPPETAPTGPPSHVNVLPPEKSEAAPEPVAEATPAGERASVPEVEPVEPAVAPSEDDAAAAAPPLAPTPPVEVPDSVEVPASIEPIPPAVVDPLESATIVPAATAAPQPTTPEAPAEASDRPAIEADAGVQPEPESTPVEPPAVPQAPPEPIPVPPELRALPTPPPPPIPAPPPVVETPSAVVPFSPRVESPREWNLWDLERIARDEEGQDAGLDEERAFLLMNLRQFANSDGILAESFDTLVRESFGPALAGRR